MRNMLTRIGFIDETSLKTNMAKTTGWSPCGARLVDHAPFGHWQTQTFIAARQDVFKYIKMFYNPKRTHTNNGMLLLVDFEVRQQKLNEAGV